VICAGRRLRRLALAVCLAYGAGLGAEIAVAVEPPSGSRNFTAPTHVPNYFSNETAPFRGTSGGQTASPGGGPVVAAPVQAQHGAVASNRRAREQSVHAGRQRARLARGKAGRHQVAGARGSRGGKSVAARNTSARSKASAVRAAPATVQRGKGQGGKAQRVARAR
jgi:hypothetical protein